MDMKFRKMLIPALLVLSLIGNLVQLAIEIAPKEEKSIAGTYCSEKANSNLAEYGKYGDYLALADDGTYARYLQHDMLEEGNYRWEKSRSAFFLENSAGYFDGKDTLTLFCGQEAITYSHILDAPAYIEGQP